MALRNDVLVQGQKADRGQVRVPLKKELSSSPRSKERRLAAGVRLIGLDYIYKGGGCKAGEK